MKVIVRKNILTNNWQVFKQVQGSSKWEPVESFKTKEEAEAFAKDYNPAKAKKPATPKKPKEPKVSKPRKPKAKVESK